LRHGEMGSRAVRVQAPRWCRPVHVHLWSASRSSLTVSASSSGPPLGSSRRPSSSTKSSAATLSIRIAAPSREISTSPAGMPACSRSAFGITKRPALSMVVRIPSKVPSCWCPPVREESVRRDLRRGALSGPQRQDCLLDGKQPHRRHLLIDVGSSKQLTSRARRANLWWSARRTFSQVLQRVRRLASSVSAMDLVSSANRLFKQSPAAC
jgi:hypothetical protein